MNGARGRVRQALRLLAIVALAIGSLWFALAGDTDLLFGLALWSLIAVPLVAAGIFAAKHDLDIGRFFGGGDPYEGHGPD